MWTAIWTLAVFVLLLFHGESILAFAPSSSAPAAPTGCRSSKSAPGKPSSATTATRSSGASLPAPTSHRARQPTMPEQPERNAVVPSTTPRAVNRTQVRVGCVPRCS